jgi:hypothetical protein
MRKSMVQPGHSGGGERFGSWGPGRAPARGDGAPARALTRSYTGSFRCRSPTGARARLDFPKGGLVKYDGTIPEAFMRRVAIVAAVLAFAGFVFAQAGCQRYELEPVNPKALGAKTEPHLIAGSRLQPYVMLVVDRSGSMDDAAGTSGGTKWNDLKANFSGSNGFLVQNGSAAQFGLILFSGGTDDNTSCVPGTVVKAVGTPSDEIVQMINQTKPFGGTPTAASLQAVLSDAKMNTPEQGRDRFVMLLTDGAPNCSNASPPPDPTTCTLTGGGSKSSSCLDDVATIDSRARAFAPSSSASARTPLTRIRTHTKCSTPPLSPEVSPRRKSPDSTRPTAAPISPRHWPRSEPSS